MRTLFFTLWLASLLGGVLGPVFFPGEKAGTTTNVQGTEEPDPCTSDPTVYCGRLRVPGG